MDIEVKRRVIEDVCELEQKGYMNTKVFEMGYSPLTIAVYGMLASYNGKVSAERLLKMYDAEHWRDPETEEDCMYALWALYKDGFIELNTLTDEGRASGK